MITRDANASKNYSGTPPLPPKITLFWPEIGEISKSDSALAEFTFWSIYQPWHDLTLCLPFIHEFIDIIPMFQMNKEFYIQISALSLHQRYTKIYVIIWNQYKFIKLILLQKNFKAICRIYSGSCRWLNMIKMSIISIYAYKQTVIYLIKIQMEQQLDLWLILTHSIVKHTL